MSPSDTITTNAILKPARRAVWRYLGGLLPVVLIWGALAGWLAWQLYDRGRWSDEADQATMREWLEESRTFRKSLTELVKEYAAVKARGEFQDVHRQEIAEQMKCMVEPTRMYANQLPSFPELLSLKITFPDETLTWTSPVPLPRTAGKSLAPSIDVYPVPDDHRVSIRCEYQLHALNRMQQREEDQQQTSLVAGVLLITATVLAVLFVRRFLEREHAREIDRLTALAQREHQERDLLAAKLDKEAAERKLENTQHEMQTQLHAGIGIMAGSYAHNIKNLLVRPNDLLARCLDGEAVPDAQRSMLHEVQATLGTVTERLQEILRTVRRDPQQSHVESLDLAAVVRESVRIWQSTAAEKWKVQLEAETPAEPLTIRGDRSHLQQILENLLFNGRDATFEMRNLYRDRARTESDGEQRKQRLLAAAGWKGHVVVRAFADGDGCVLEVRDNGIGMTDDVKANCLKTHFTTKKDNALYEGYSTGSGLGLAFVAMIAKQHDATIILETAPQQGTTLRIRFPRLAPNPATR
ncbi:hypothetical protein BH11PLA2_BH11PLA2_08260 [soil metagenome]